jgi:hypothetical protein
MKVKAVIVYGEGIMKFLHSVKEAVFDGFPNGLLMF